jgi:hypothetical protein
VAISSRVVNSTRSHHMDGSRAATWPEKTISSKVSIVGPDPPWESTGPLYMQTGPPGEVQNLHGCRSDPPDGALTPLREVRAIHGGDPGFWDKEYPDLNRSQEGVRSRHMSRPYRVRLCSSLRRSPDAAMWPTARDVSQWAEPDIRPLDRVASAFIVDKARYLSIPLAGDVPPRHLMSPVHSTGRRCAASAFNVPCPLRWQAATRPSCRRRACPIHWQAVRLCCGVHYAHHRSRVIEEAARDINTICTIDIMAPEDCPDVAGYFYSVFPPFCSWAHMSGLSTLVRAPLSYKREGTRRYKASSLRHSDSQVHTSSQAKYNTQWSRVLRSGGPNHSKPLSVLVFIFHLASRQNA